MAKWVKILGYPAYSVSDEGEVRNDKTNHILSGGANRSGYIHITLCKDGKTKIENIHRLVARAFVPNLDNKPQVNHIDGDKANNAAINLEWVTAKENVNHSFKVLDSSNRREKQASSKKGNTYRSIPIVRIEDGKVYKSIKEAADDIQGSSTVIARACKGQVKTSGGYHWKYLKEASNV